MPLVSANQFNLVPEISRLGSGFAQGAQLGHQFQQNKRLGAQEERAQTQFDSNQAAAGVKANRQADVDRVKSVINASVELKNLPTTELKISYLQRRVAGIDGGEIPGSDSNDSREALGLYQSGRIEEADALVASVVQSGIENGIIEKPDSGQFTLGQTRFDNKGNVISQVAAKPPTPTPLQRNLEAAGLKPGTLEFKDAILKDVNKTKSNQKDFNTYQELKKTDPEAAKIFGQVSGFITIEGKELSVHLQKRLSQATDKAVKSRSNAVEYNTLAARFEDANVGGGYLEASWKEAYKDAVGSQDGVSELRRRYAAVRGSQVVDNLPPGSASDVDIALALAGFPSENASGKQLASFLRGTAKLELAKADFEDFKANYISENNSERNLLKSWKSDQSNKVSAEKLSDDDLKKSLGL
jgi:hypothetical protein